MGNNNYDWDYFKIVIHLIILFYDNIVHIHIHKFDILFFNSLCNVYNITI